MTNAQKWPIRHQHIKNPDGETVIVPWSGGSWVLARDVSPLLELYEAVKDYFETVAICVDANCMWKAFNSCRKLEEEARHSTSRTVKEA